jgi:hypothetical protein
MRIKIPRKPQAWLRRLAAAPAPLARVAGAGLLLAGLSAQAQTVTTVFSEDFEGATNGFTLENGSQTNQWAVAGTGGNGPTSPGTKAAYISTDLGVSNTYSITAASTVHLYRDVVLPAGQAAIQLSFDWKGAGESTYDYLLVQVAPTTFAPVAGHGAGPAQPPAHICAHHDSAAGQCGRHYAAPDFYVDQQRQ